MNLLIGFGFSFFILELIARILPARDNLALDTPIICNDINKIDLNCLHRRASYLKGRYTIGKFPPFPVDAIKTTNDIGQFSDIDFKTFIKNKSGKIRILTIGDSQVEALQVDNNESFHGVEEMKNHSEYRHFIYGGFTLLNNKNPYITNKSSVDTEFHLYE